MAAPQGSPAATDAVAEAPDALDALAREVIVRDQTAVIAPRIEGQPPVLEAASPATSGAGRMYERIAWHAGAYWYSWGEPIGSDPAHAADLIAKVLATVSGG